VVYVLDMDWLRRRRSEAKWSRRGEVERRVVDDRVFLLGLDELYREAVKPRERGELLDAARAVARSLGVAPVAVPVEGYYHEDERLTDYFLLMRGLQAVSAQRVPEVEGLAEYQRLVEVASAPLYGEAYWGDELLLPVGRDALARALETQWPAWDIETLTQAAHTAALEHDDFSLVGLAARAGDPVVMAALRESVVLYAMVALGYALPPPESVYVWEVDADLAEAAGRFIATFNALFDEDLPTAESKHAEQYWLAYVSNVIVGRCARIGRDEATPPNHYHWAIAASNVVEDFWDTEVWTTERYRATKLGY
jgi:hypothetical protein